MEIRSVNSLAQSAAEATELAVDYHLTLMVDSSLCFLPKMARK